MSNENSITEAVKQFNASLQLMEAALVMVEAAVANDKPISQLAKLTVQDCCERIIEECETLFNKMED